ncbi:uncharacterized protein L969DRAFT_385984 [Mixia osmundae IAM 14324]|uniref:AMP-dependent synthetase/ligase domain-containing protein n=1 Tax=Mixia osmundae (strain CBS 9802 / IAM 14324 / JCM 22182 / KY 12970) TaxID=764103 RepID=G7E9I6_MIXOS|nr:uncharacterized protein L969DRAFT_385984 [Mixia osmundae IAM 14324]KEI39937.1 hypothetical protein L969DRAFT_385984 [Mixia osmundae IAM 14324]GAA99305.1 hypothetical protein E5Q_06000 [Mixia osmundae IAM 14324]
MPKRGHVYHSPWEDHPTLDDNKRQSVWSLVWSNPNNVPDDKPAVVDGSTRETVTRKQLREQSQRLAAGLTEDFGVKQGDVVCLFSPNSIHYHAIIFACQCAGIVFSGANTAYTPTELTHQLSKSKAKLLLAHPSNFEVALKATKALGWTADEQKQRIALSVRRSEVDGILKHASAFRPDHPPADGPAGDEKPIKIDAELLQAFKTIDQMQSSKLMQAAEIPQDKLATTLAYLMFSSGTTSAAKGVMTSQLNMTSVLSGLHPFKCTSDDVHLAFLPFSHIYALTKVVHWPILEGCTVVIMPKFNLKHFCELVQRYKATIVMLVPPVALQLAKDPIVDDYDFGSLRLVVSGAAPMGAELEKTVAERLGCHVAQAYGLTESSPTTHFCSPEAPRTGSIGFLLPGVRGRLVDPETMKDITEEGREGELWMQGDNIMMGYFENEEATKETLVEDHWLRTGDIATCIEDYWTITDRMKELLKVLGYQVPPASLEATCLTHPHVKDVGVVGVYSEGRASEFPRAYIVPSDPTAAAKNEAAYKKAIQDHVTSRVPKHFRLGGGIIFIEEIPKSASGKILRRVLRERVKKEPYQEEARQSKL